MNQHQHAANQWQYYQMQKHMLQQQELQQQSLQQQGFTKKKGCNCGKKKQMPQNPYQQD